MKKNTPPSPRNIYFAVKIAFLAALGAMHPVFAGDSLPPATPDFSPGPGYDDSTRMFQGIPGIERAPNGRLWAAWYGGGVGEGKDNYVILDTSGDEGKTWQRVFLLDPDGAGPMRAFDPCLWLDPDGHLWLFWSQQSTSKGLSTNTLCALMTTDPDNADAHWSEPREIAPGVMMNKPLVTANGRWLLPVAAWQAEGSAGVVVSTDHGNTFTHLGAANIPKKEDRNYDEHMLVERKDGTLWMLVRTKYGIGESTSTDGGATWTDVTPSPIPNAVSRFFIRRLASGRLLLVRHNVPNNSKKRSHLSAFVSDDDGRTWKGGLLLDERTGVSYPDGTQAKDGSIDVIYDYQRMSDKEILLAEFTEDDVLAGKLTSPNSRQRARVNQATGVNTDLETKPVPAGKDATAEGVPSLDGPAAEFATDATETDRFEVGAKLFLNRDYTVYQAPEALSGCRFLRSDLEHFDAVCQKPGVVFVVTPSKGRNPHSRSAVLEEMGFEKVDLPEFLLFNSSAGVANLCSVYQKQMAVGEELKLKPWGVVVLPEK